MNYFYGKTYIEDNDLIKSCGRIVIYENSIETSVGPSRNHNDLSHTIAAKLVTRIDDVADNAVRLFYYKKDDKIVISPVRKIDDKNFEKNWEQYRILIRKVLR